MTRSNGPAAPCWFVMRDLKRSNAKLPAYRMLADAGMEIFTPMHERLALRQGRRVRKLVPVMQDLLFVHDTRANLDPVVLRTPTLQYRFVRHGYCQPMVVPDEEMARFIHAVTHAEKVHYYRPGEITSQMHGRRIRIVGGPLDGYEGTLLTTRGSRSRRLLVEIPDLLAAGVEVRPEYIQLL